MFSFAIDELTGFRKTHRIVAGKSRAEPIRVGQKSLLIRLTSQQIGSPSMDHAPTWVSFDPFRHQDKRDGAEAIHRQRRNVGWHRHILLLRNNRRL